MARILLGETQADLAEAMKDCLLAEHCTVTIETNGLRILECLRQGEYEVVILELALQGLDAISIVRDFRAAGGSTPILLIASQRSSNDLQASLDAGADAFLVRPFQLHDLTALLRALLRRPDLRSTAVLRSGFIELNAEAGTVTKNDIPIHLYPMEFKLLEFLLRHPNQVFNAQALYRRVWQKDSNQLDDTVRTHVRSLRRKVDIDGEPSIITTVRGLGYKSEHR